MPSPKNQPPASKHGEYKRPRKRTLVGAIFTFAIVVIVTVFVLSVFLRVSDIRVEGNEHYTDEEIIKAIDIEQGDNLFFFDRFAAISRIFAKLPYVEEVSVTRQLPNRVIITVEECKALACIRVGDEYWTIDHSCKILGKATDSELESLIPIQGLNPGTLLIGERLTSADGDESIVQFVADVLYQVEGRGMAPAIKNIDFADPMHVTLRYLNRFTFAIGGAGDIGHKFAMLESALSQMKEGDSGVINVSDDATAHFVPQ